MQTAKQEVQQLLQGLPDDATLEDIRYHIYVKQRIALGLADVRAGRLISQDEVEKRFARWPEGIKYEIVTPKVVANEGAG